MPYQNIGQLPQNVKHVLPKHAQEIYKSSFNSAWKEYKNPADRYAGSDREETAHRVAWSAVKQSYKKGSDDAWRPK